MYTPQLYANNIFPGSTYYLPNIFMSDGNKHPGGSEKKTASISSLLQDGLLRVMLADDDLDDRELFAEAIADTGFHVSLEYAEDGNDLMTILNKDRKLLPHLLFLDLNMPNKSGRECLEAIRKNEKLGQMTVVIYSTSSSPKDINDTFEKGANLYVRKPSSFNDLQHIIRQVLLLDWDQYKPNMSRHQFLFSSRIN